MQNKQELVPVPAFVVAMCVYRRFGRLAMRCAFTLRSAP